MNYVDLILKYLSGELSPEEEQSFKEELNSNGGLQKEYAEVSKAYELIRDQLQKRDAFAFREKLQEAMDHELPPSSSSRYRIRPFWYIPMALAASLAILWVLVLNQTGNEKILTMFYTPNQDPVLLAYMQDTRGDQEAGILYFRKGSYSEAMKVLELRIIEEPDNKVLLLYYLLSAMELDREDEVLPKLLITKLEDAHLPDQAISWYSTLALIKTDRREEAVKTLVPLTVDTGPYQSHAEKLLKLLLK